ncbi:MAG: Lipoprotein-releasing system ATP-binding protein LolD [Syntrophorhabdaceae bacterium PtaU1.Bin034]|nr:MAG: Lipoprotein-releasing system ATP-binding protein LolD [Syntrophorhabdaceae bacterium PtaU1.Bin034]
MNNLISVRGLKKSFDKDGTKVHILKGIDLDISEGEFLTVMGPSGAGKTTFLHIIGSLDRPTAGEILYKGRNIGSHTEQEQSQFRNEKVGFVFQFYHLLGDFTVLENIMIPLWIKRVKATDANAAAEEFLEIMGLVDRRDHKPGELSGGEQQRVAIARALINRPELILADEPTGNLDRRTGREVLDYILSVQRKIGAALVLVTHDPEIGMAGSTKLTMVDGELFSAE